MYDLLDTDIILSEADLFMKQNTIGNNTKANIIFNNNTVTIQSSNGTLSNKVEPGDLSKEGLVSKEKLNQIKNLVESVTFLRIKTVR